MTSSIHSSRSHSASASGATSVRDLHSAASTTIPGSVFPNGNTGMLLTEELRADAKLLQWLRDRITLPGFTPNMWTEEHDMVASDFLLNKNITKLVVYMDRDIGLYESLEDELTIDNISRIVQYGVLSGAPMDSLLKIMAGVYVPSFLANHTWPESVKKEFSGQLHKFMASLTETANQVHGHTVLYLPDEHLENIEQAAQDKDLVQRLESTLIHWTRQIKEVVSNQETSHHVDNSGPLEEIQFWRSRTLDLSGIRAQLDRQGVRSIVAVLRSAGSSYLRPFETLSEMIQQGSIEANDNLRFLETLQKPCQVLAQATPQAIPGVLPEILNLIRMIWTISSFYNTDERLTGLLRKVSNQIIIQCSKKISLAEIFDGDVEAAMVQLRESIACGKAWHQAYEKTVRAIEKDPKSRKWHFDPSTHGIFAQIDAFVQRCHNLIEVCEGQLQFARRSKAAQQGGKSSLPAFGGSRGSEIEKSLLEIEQAFGKHIDKLRRLDYDILNVKATHWHYDYNFFKNGLKDLEVMMSNVISSAWEGISTVTSGVELLENFYRLAVRPGMKTAVERKTAEVYAMFQAEIKRVKGDFDRHKKEPPLPQGQPRYAGSALWARSLLTRIEGDFRVLEAAQYLANKQDIEEARTSFQQLASILEGFIRQMHLEWIDSMHQAAADQSQLSDRLDRPLMIRADDNTTPAKKGQTLIAKKASGHLESNFDKHLLRLFNEVRYWEKFHGDYPIPYIAHEMYLQQDALRVLRESVMLVVRDYNTIIDALSVEERRLFHEHLRRVDRKIAPGLNKLSWSEKHIKDWFVRVCRQKCSDVYEIVLQFKEHHARILANCARMADCLLVDIEKNVVYDDVAFEQRQVQHQSRVRAELETLHADIIATVQASYAFFADHPPEIQREWQKYVRKCDARVEEALRTTVKRSLQELSRAINGDNKNEPHALFKVNMILDEAKGKVEFRPTMSDLSNMVKQISRQSITTIQVVPRLTEVLKYTPKEGESKENMVEEKTQETAVLVDGVPQQTTVGAPGAGATANGTVIKATRSFYDVISNDEKEILHILVNIMHGTTNVAVDLGKIISHYDRYAPIWNTDKAAFIRRYANTRRPLASFDMDITRYKNNQQDIQAEDNSHTVNFIRVDCTLLKQSLVSHCQQWQLKLTTLLHQNATTELYAIHDAFVQNSAKLQQKPEVLDKLAEAIKLLQKLQSEAPAIEAKFEPIEETYKCLDKFDVHIGDEEKELLDHLRGEWAQFQATLADADQMLKLKMVDMKKELEDNLVSYNQHVLDTRTEFKEHAPFAAPAPGAGEPDIEGAFAFINEFKKRLSDNRARADAMKRGMEIFGIEQPEYKETEETERELGMLERVWTLMREWLDKWNGWRTCTFSDLSVRELDTQAQTYQKNLNKLGRAVKQWKVWRSLYAIIQRFRQTMPLITDLRSPAMRPRHWDQLREEVQQDFDPNSESFTLDRVFALNLHAHADAIANIASIATRELAIETNLQEIANTWTVQQLDIVPYKGKYFMLRSVDEVNDTLENDQMTLSTMKNSPFYLTFSTSINQWARTLNELVEMMEMLVTVQRQWRYLESIFMDSQDIRKQLPSESTLFETVNNQWIDVMGGLARTKLVIDTVASGNELLDRLTRMNETLDKINHSLDQYLEKKRGLFPRFYFLSNDDLLEILGQSRDPTEIQKHIRKCFVGIKQLELLSPAKTGNKYYEVVGIISPDGECVKLTNPVVVEGQVEAWLTDVERAMQETLQKLLYVAITHVQKASHKKSALENWVKSAVGQLLIVSGQIGWTAKCAAALSDLQKNKRAMRRLKSEWHEYLNKLARYVRGDLDPIERLKLTALITIEVHARDVIDRLKQASKSKVGINSFEWTSQLRFYFDKPQGDFGKAVVKQTNTMFNYGYEYQGNNGRLVITPLTDRCYMTLTTALSLARGGSPQGPAGTGKTETVKDLGKGLGKMVIVFNCSDQMGVDSLGRHFSGLAQTGAWGCFDEFNRIMIEVLSVVTLQIASILDAIRAGLSVFTFEMRQIKIDRTVGIFVTMNPGYAGRTELPDNLKSLFRPVAMMVPESEMIAEIILQSEGFKDSQALARKCVSIYNLIERQLSKQPHYAYGLRAIKSTLARAGALIRRKDNDLSEELVLMRALRDMNASKLVAEDIFLFDSLLADIFPNVELPQLDYQIMRAEMERQCVKQGLQIQAIQMDKIIQLHQTQEIRHGNMLVGQALSGKSTAWRILAKTLSSLAEQKIPGFQDVEIHVLNPKSVSIDELYGNYDRITKEWGDGILSSLMRKVCTSETSTHKWIVLDGPVDTLWIESMNTVLDDNKVLTLINGDRISMPPQVTLLFEVEDLKEASPATVSRCGMVYVDREALGWRPFVASWLAQKAATIEEKKTSNPAAAAAAAAAGNTATATASTAGSASDAPLPVSVATGQPARDPTKVAPMTKDSVELLTKLFDKYVIPILHFRANHASELRELIPVTDFAAVRSLCRLFDSLATPENGCDPTDDTNYLRMIEMWFTFSCIWSLGASVDDAGRHRLDVFIRDLEAQFPPLQTCYEYFVDPNKKDWALWEDKVNNSWRPSPATPFFRILVPTIDTVRYHFVISALVRHRHNVLAVGSTGTGKTSLIESLLESSDAASTLALTINFSSATSSEAVQQTIESRLEKRQRNNYGPLGARSRLIVFIDDLNMPKKDTFGSQPAHELLRQWVDYGFWYDRAKQFRKNVLDMQLVAAMGPPGGARSEVSARFQAKFNLINFTPQHDNQVKRIFRTLLVNHLSDFDEVIKPLGIIITQATLDLYKQVESDFLPTPSTSHYLFNLRDMSKVFQGLLQSDPKYYDTKESMIRLWVHESMRVFHDRLVSDDDRDKFADLINAKLHSLFETSWKKLFKDGKTPMFADFLEETGPVNATISASAASAAGINAAGNTGTVTYDDREDRAPYQDLSAKMPKVKALMEEKLAAYNLDPDHVPQDLVLFDEAVEHIARIYRVLRQERGHMMLVGVGGSGRQSLTRLAAYMCGYTIVQIAPTKRYKLQNFREDLKELFRKTGVACDPCVFLLSDTQLVHESFLEDINNMLNSGEVPRLFPQDELIPILDELRTDATKAGRSSSTDALYAYFIERVRNHLHIVLCMSPVGAAFRNRCRMFPALVNCTTIDWFTAWGQASLLDVANRFLKDIDVGGPKVKEALCQVFTSMHTSAVETSHRMLIELKRQNYITPTKYLDLVKGYKALLADKRLKTQILADKLKNGLDKLENSSVQVKAMTTQLEEKKKVVAQKKIICDKLLVEIVQKQRAADEQKKQVELDAVRTEGEARECEQIQREAAEELDKVTPALEKAIRALDKLSKAAVTEVKSYPKPPKPVEKVMCAVMVILEKEPSWAAAKKELSDPNFLHRLKEFDKDKISNATLKQIGKYTKNKDFNADDIANVSMAAGALCDWVCAMELYAKVFRDVEPRRIALRKAEVSLKKKQEELQAAEAQLAEVINKVQKLEEKFKESETEQNTLRKEAKFLENKLARAAKLVEGLSGEKTRWESTIKAYQIDIKNFVGDCTVAAAFLSYAGPFTSQYREALLKKHWTPVVRKLNLPYSPTFDIRTFLADPTDVMDWNIQGLPSDSFSTENGILVQAGFRWPLMIDPQGQANIWVKAKEQHANLKVVDFQMPNYMNVLEQCVVHGTPLLIQDVGEDLDSSLEPLLRVSQANLDAERKSTIMFGEKEVSYNSSFRLYMTTKLQNPHYKPEVCIKTTIVNFAVKEKGLQDQLLGIVVRMEEPKLENDKASLVKTVAEGKRKLAGLEDEILSLLKTASSNLLDDEELINALQLSKSTSEEVKDKLDVSQKTEQKIDAAREGYRPCAIRASICFFVLNDLALVDPMYQFSLKSYVDLFKTSIALSKDDKSEHTELADRIAALNDYHTEAVYKYACRALFEKHKLLLAFQLCVQKMKSEDAMDQAEYDFFLRGGQVLDRTSRPPNPCPDWLSELSWDSITELDKLPGFKNLAHSFEQNAAEWRSWYRADEPPPEKITPPGEWHNNGKRDNFQQMLVLRCLRPDRVIFAARHFISANLGPQFIESPPFDLHEIYRISTSVTPLIFVLSAGVDPSFQLSQLAKHYNQHLDILALGQGQAPIAMELIEQGIKHGNWVFLANCHLSIKWLPELDKMVERIALMKTGVHPNFRLWLSSDPHPRFPISLLQNAVKMTTEPPKGLKANLMRLYNNMSEEQFTRCKKPEKYKKLLFALCFFHSIVIERKKFLSLGWNEVYAFNDSDFSVCENILAQYLDDYEETPWDALKYLIAQANYGGRVTDNIDRRLLDVYASQYFCEQALSVPKYPLSSLDTYYIPEDGSLDHYKKYISTLPKADQDPPEAFGQHPNADIASQLDDTKTLLGTILSLQPRVVTEGGRTKEETLLELITQLLEQLPAELDIRAIQRHHEQDKSPLTIVLVQELDRYSGLLSLVHRSLRSLQKGIRGLVVISPELEAMMESLYLGVVPPMWQFLYHSVKPLGPWIRDLSQRISQLKKWSDDEPPKVFWLSGFTFPVGFLTALLQMSARRNGVSIEALSWDYVVMGSNEQAINVRPKEGAYIKGLYLEGARWDADNGCLSEPQPMELYCPMPIIHFRPVITKKTTKGLHPTPMYYYPVRSGSRENPSFLQEVDLKTGPRDSQFWTKRGTALLLALDD